MSRIKMASEIIQAMQYLGIPTEKFKDMRIKAGSLENLYDVMALKLGVK